MTAVQDGPTSIRVSWIPSSDATGYGITYTGGGSSDSVAVGDTNSHTLMGLTNGETYTISIAGISSSPGAMLRAPLLVGDFALGKFKNPSNAVCMEPIIHATFISKYVLVCVWELRVCYDSVPLL